MRPKSGSFQVRRCDWLQESPSRFPTTSPSFSRSTTPSGLSAAARDFCCNLRWSPDCLDSPSPLLRRSVCQFALSNNNPPRSPSNRLDVHRDTPSTPNNTTLSNTAPRPRRSHDDIIGEAPADLHLHPSAQVATVLTTVARHVTAAEWCECPAAATHTLPP